MNSLTKKAALTLLLALPSLGFADTFGYSIASSTNDLYSIDLANGMATDLGTINTDAVLGGIAASGSNLYAVSTSDNGSSPSQLYNVTTPPGSLIGDTGARFGNTTGAAYRSQDGFIYDLGSSPSLMPGASQSALYQIDPATGRSMLLGSSTLYANGLAFTSGGMGYATDFQQTGSLYSIALNPYSLTLVGSFGLGIGGTGFNSGAAFDPATGALYVLREDGAIFTVAASGANAGAATFDSFVTDTSNDQRVPSSLEGLAVNSAATPTPEPASLLLVLPALLLFVLHYKRRLKQCPDAELNVAFAAGSALHNLTELRACNVCRRAGRE